jgi:hypothetical protein
VLSQGYCGAGVAGDGSTVTFELPVTGATLVAAVEATVVVVAAAADVVVDEEVVLLLRLWA